MHAIGRLGERMIALAGYLGGLVKLLGDSLWWMTAGPLRRRGRLRYGETLEQSCRVSWRSFGIVNLVIFFVGMILAFQLAYVLKRLGVVEYVANITGVAMFREMGPLLVAMVMTGFTGAAVAAELGTMVVSEEVMALETSALHPVRFLVVPRVLASMLMMPCVSLVATYVGVLGGYCIGTFLLGIESERYIRGTLDSLKASDVLVGLAKAEAFGLLIALIACYEGLHVTGGAEGVGRATTNSVVRSIVAIIICDLVFTAIFFYV